MVSTARAFMERLDMHNFAYQHNPDSNDIFIRMGGCKNVACVQMLFCFSDDCKSVTVCEYELIKYNPDKIVKVMSTVNWLNFILKFITLSINTESQSVAARMHAFFPQGCDVVNCCVDLMELFVQYCDKCYPELQKAMTE